MAAFDDKAIIEFLRRSYFAVDGAWFVRAEDEHSYRDALRLDEQVWRIVPKVQARKARQILGIEGGSLSDLAQGLELRFAAEGCEHHIVESTPEILMIDLPRCPWLEGVVRSGRQGIIRDVCERVCTADDSTWASEFSEDIGFHFEGRLSEGDAACRFVFTRACGEGVQPCDDGEELEAAG